LGAYAVLARFALLAAVCLSLFIAPRASFADDTPQVGDKVAPFQMEALSGDPVNLSALLKKGPVVLIVLRGYPGYQCPYCTRQVAELVGKNEQFTAAKAQVVLVYPGPSASLKERAGEFAGGKNLPANFHFTLDPDFVFVNRLGLRWDAPGETAYPSTFVINRKGKVVWEKVSHSHGDRAKTDDILAALAAK